MRAIDHQTETAWPAVWIPSLSATECLLLRASGNSCFLEAVGAAELLAEPFNATGRVDKFLLTGEERMAGRTDIDIDLRLRAAGREFVATGTLYMAGDIPGMDFFFHRTNSLRSACVEATSRQRQPTTAY